MLSRGDLFSARSGLGVQMLQRVYANPSCDGEGLHAARLQGIVHRHGANAKPVSGSHVRGATSAKCTAAVVQASCAERWCSRTWPASSPRRWAGVQPLVPLAHVAMPLLHSRAAGCLRVLGLGVVSQARLPMRQHVCYTASSPCPCRRWPRSRGAGWWICARRPAVRPRRWRSSWATPAHWWPWSARPARWGRQARPQERLCPCLSVTRSLGDTSKVCWRLRHSTGSAAAARRLCQHN